MSKEIHQNVAWTFIPVNWYLWITKKKKCLQNLKCVEKKNYDTSPLPNWVLKILNTQLSPWALEMQNRPASLESYKPVYLLKNQ